MTDSMISYRTIFEATNNLPMQIVIGHGENADLVAGFTDGGVEVNLSGYTARAIYQPKSKWGTDDWYECPCEIVDDTVIAHWGNTYDNGDDAVKLFMHLAKNGKVAYPAIYQIRLFETPGFTPSAIEPIPETIDFAQYQLENAPWVLPSDLSGYATKAEATLSVTYSQNPQFTDWTVNYSFEVSWDNEHSIWVFESGFGDTVSGDTAEWHNPNATHLYVYHADTDLEANRTRLDVGGYVLGSQTDKPLQPMGDYATIDDVVQMGQTITNNLPFSIREVTIGQGGTVYPVSREVVGVKFSDAQARAFSIKLPNPTDGKAVDFYVDICNNHDYSLPATLINTGWGEEPYIYAWKFAVDASETLSSILAIKGQDTSSGYTRLHFSQIGLDTNSDPILNITKQEFNIQNS